MGHLLNLRYALGTLEWAYFIFNKRPIYTHDGASAKFNTYGDETDYIVPVIRYWLDRRWRRIWWRHNEDILWHLHRRGSQWVTCWIQDTNLNVCILSSTSVPFRPTTVKMPNLALFETKRITMYLCCCDPVLVGSSMRNDLMTSHWGYFVSVRNLMKDLANMSGLSLAHWVTTHLSTLFYTVMPLLTTVNNYLE